MLSIAVITSAGVSSRFNYQQSQQCLKAIYSEGDRRNTLLYRQCRQCCQCDRIIVVGGWQFDALKNYIDEVLPDEIRKKIIAVFNPHYADYASGYSLYLGLQAAFELGTVREIIFIEGDLVVDTKSLTEVFAAQGDVLTFNREVIDSQKAVVFYEDALGKYCYAFNSSHGLLSIDEPFRRIWNSGQIWKFVSISKLERVCDDFFYECVIGTNLEIIQRYFDQVAPRDNGGGWKLSSCMTGSIAIHAKIIRRH